MSDTLKLIAQNHDDLTILSALLQDMTIKVSDIAWLPQENRVACVGNRFVWEKKRKLRRPKGERKRTAFHFNNVLETKLKGIDLGAEDTVLSLLSVTAETETSGYHIYLNFAGGATLLLMADTIDCIASDLSDTWQAIARPHHA